MIVWFCHPQLISDPKGEAVYNIFHNIDCSGNTNSNEVVKLKEDATIPNSKTHVGSPGHFSYMAKYLALLRANQIFTDIYLDQEGSDITGKEVNVGTIVHDTATLHGHFIPPYEGKIT